MNFQASPNEYTYNRMFFLQQTYISTALHLVNARNHSRQPAAPEISCHHDKIATGSYQHVAGSVVVAMLNWSALLASEPSGAHSLWIADTKHREFCGSRKIPPILHPRTVKAGYTR